MGSHTFEDPIPVGRTELDRERNAALLGGYDYARSVAGITGYGGQDLQRVVHLDRSQAAVRTRVGERGNYKAGMTLCPNGKLVLAVCRTPDREGRTFDIVVYESADQGLTWQEIATPGYPAKEPSLTVTADGAILLTAQHAEFRPGVENLGAWVARSVDGGHTWERSNLPRCAYPRNVVLEPDGTLLFLADAETPDQLILCRSRDHGVSWEQSRGEIPWAPETRSGFGEISVLRLDDGRLLAALRHSLPPHLGGDMERGARGHGFADTVLVESSDNGATWSTPRRLTGIGEVHVDLLRLADGRLLATYVNYHLPFGVCAIVSDDSGATWDVDHPVQLSCSAFGPSNNGWPVTLQFPGGSLLTSYAANAYPDDGPPTMVCEVVRWSLPSRTP